MIAVRTSPYTRGIRLRTYGIAKVLASENIFLNTRAICAGISHKLLNNIVSAKPIVSFVGSAEILENNKTALVIENENVAGFENAIFRLLNKPQFGYELYVNARKETANKYSWTIVTEKYRNIYESILQKYINRKNNLTKYESFK